ncbi:tetratricopeptide repeat protein [Azospirillum sp. TSO35-2]|uniref:glycosyltransferase family 9 protein n=1 Tax=Azospirillum sp. TSO35-2 TaxID=716796 RepID=UPI000D653FE7|nr:tetratricopeptide repeat protein [Azospirillum sp. TSO35-2]
MPALPDDPATAPQQSPEFLAGLLASQKGDRTAAFAAFARAAARFPAHGPIHGNLGTLAGQLGHGALAARCFRRGLAVDPGHAELWSNFGSQLRRTHRDVEAVAALKRALCLAPRHANALCNLGAILFEAGHSARAEACFRQALALAPHLAEAAKNLGFALLRRGELRAGFGWYEQRHAVAPLPPPALDTPVPRWQGGSLDGLSLLAVAEQGEGDTIQFVRYAKLVERGGGALTLLCSPALKRLMTRAEGVRRVALEGERVAGVDAWVPLLSLPHLLGTDRGSVPGGIPYLHPAPEDAAAWRARLSGAAGLKVGLVWAGNPAFDGDHRRSPRFAAVAPLLDLPGVHMVCLQVGDGRRDLVGRGLAGNATDLGAEIHDFADTAAIMAGLDLVITSCTAPAHLAGALGRPVWIMLPFAADWRWMEGRTDSPWYPTARLFRQPAPGDWTSVVAALSAELQAVVAGRRPLDGLV